MLEDILATTKLAEAHANMTAAKEALAKLPDR